MIRVNDKWDVAWRPGMTVRDMLAALQFTHPVLVVSVNGMLVLPEEYPTRLLAEYDQITVTHVIAGG